MVTGQIYLTSDHDKLRQRKVWVWTSSSVTRDLSVDPGLGLCQLGKHSFIWTLLGHYFPKSVRENAWPDPYMVTLGWACNTWWVGTPWDKLDIDRYAVGRHAIGHSRLHSDPGPSLVSLWRIRGRTETLICCSQHNMQTHATRIFPSVDTTG